MLSQSTFMFVAIVLTLAGVWLRWRASMYRMEAEEALKDRKITSRQCEVRLSLVRMGGSCLTLAGIGLLVATMLLLGY